METKYDANSSADFEKFLRATGRVFYHLTQAQRKEAAKEFKAACG